MFRYLPWSDESFTMGEDVETMMVDIRMTFIVMSIFYFVLSFLICYMIPNQAGSNPKDPSYRRRIFWAFGVGLPLITYLPYILGARGLISDEVDALVPQFFQSTLISGAGCMAGYVLLGAILSKVVLPRTKYGDIFGKRLNR